MHCLDSTTGLPLLGCPLEQIDTIQDAMNISNSKEWLQ